MSDLFIEDTHHLRAAKGWLELCNHVEAFNELEKIAPRNRAAPDVLEVRWQIYTMAGRHDAALTIADALVNAAGRRYQGHIYRAHSLDKLGRTREAINHLTSVILAFDGVGIVPFHLACYHAALGELGEAKDWLECAFRTPEAKELKLKALDDPALKELWEQIGNG